MDKATIVSLFVVTMCVSFSFILPCFAFCIDEFAYSVIIISIAS